LSRESWAWCQSRAGPFKGRRPAAVASFGERPSSSGRQEPGFVRGNPSRGRWLRSGKPRPDPCAGALASFGESPGRAVGFVRGISRSPLRPTGCGRSPGVDRAGRGGFREMGSLEPGPGFEQSWVRSARVGAGPVVASFGDHGHCLSGADDVACLLMEYRAGGPARTAKIGPARKSVDRRPLKGPA